MGSRAYAPMMLVIATCAAWLTACAHPRPYSFSDPLRTDQAVSQISSVLQSQGYKIVIADKQAGRIITSWKDTGYREGPDEDPWLIFLRYRVTVVPPDGAKPGRVLLVPEGRQCGGSTCYDMRLMFWRLQHDVDLMGAKLQAVVIGR